MRIYCNGNCRVDVAIHILKNCEDAVKVKWIWWKIFLLHKSWDFNVVFQLTKNLTTELDDDGAGPNETLKLWKITSYFIEEFLSCKCGICQTS